MSLIFFDDTAFGGRRLQRAEHEVGQFAVDAWEARNCMLLSAAKHRYLYIERSPHPISVLSSDDSGTLLLSYLDLRIRINLFLKQTIQEDVAATTSCNTLAFISKNCKRLFSDIFLSAYSAQVKLILKLCAQAGL